MREANDNAVDGSLRCLFALTTFGIFTACPRSPLSHSSSVSEAGSFDCGTASVREAIPSLRMTEGKMGAIFKPPHLS